ncbi:hypothetical protein [Methylobacterium brachythecii]|uniref:Anti-sigma factor NepR domain-containing protein n=1 Tax=Methylobacterium brachythecii TaxID=1176177 RepID=A0A7W6F5J7_9HYPH|nr:hypothetical protein [Methylobacterium brachythecii]MBB3900966.1 hypothetical protein [Methylobacterium brachythecii]GLS45267.1 hypothetical protein GCM10007884_32560 [Methylobacterium brachythecii]
MSNSERPLRAPEPNLDASPKLDEGTRARLGEQLKRLYDPIIEEQLDPHLVELLQLLAAER